MIAPAPRNPLRTCLVVLCSLGMAAGLNSCANIEEHEKLEEAREREEAIAETYELKEKLAVRNEVYANLQERRRMRKQAREDRYQAWWDRVMH